MPYRNQFNDNLNSISKNKTWRERERERERIKMEKTNKQPVRIFTYIYVTLI